MDPTTLLAELRQLATIATDEQLSPITRNGHARRLAERFQQLDEWLSRRGFLPAQWASSVATIVDEIERELDARPTWSGEA